jgi:selenocysteine lyase/cysteine desulfurase
LIFSVGDAAANKALHSALRAKGIIVTYRSGTIRVSPSFFNTEEEIAAFVEAI